MRRIGSFFYFSKKRYIFYFLFLFSTLSLQVYLFQKTKEVKALEERLQEVIEKAQKTKKDRINLYQMKKRLQKADPFFLEKKLSTSPLLLEKASCFLPKEHPLFWRNKKIKEIPLSFTEKRKTRGPFFTEALYSLENEVNIDKKGLENLLSLIERTEIGSFSPSEEGPDYIVTQFTLEKESRYFVLHFEILERSPL